MVSNLRLVDPSTATNPKFPDGLEMLAFSAQQHHLPTLRRSGDVIRLHRVTVSYLQLLQLLPGLNPKTSWNQVFAPISSMLSSARLLSTMANRN